MKKFKITLNYEIEVEAEEEEDVLMKFFDDMAFSNETPDVWIADRMEIKEIKKK